MTAPSSVNGSCLCGSTTYTLYEPESNLIRSLLCHCSLCQRLNGAPYIWTTHWKKDSVKWTGKEPARFEVKKDRKWRLRCQDCGCPIGTWNSAQEKWSLWPSDFERDPDTNRVILQDAAWLKPTSHTYYGTRMADVEDKLPKWEGVPKDSQRLDNQGHPVE